MKREYVLPDLLASMTADALFAGPSQKNAAKPGERKPGAMPGRWFRAAAPGKATPAAPGLASDDDWVGVWYARTRMPQAPALANKSETIPVGVNSADRSAEGDGAAMAVSVVNQVKDWT